MIHLITMIGSHVDVLPQMLDHYRSIGIESFFVNLHLQSEDDPVREQVEAVTRDFGCGVASTTVGPWLALQQELYMKQREEYPTDWFVLADQDEFQQYPAKIQDVIAGCGRWDFIRGLIVDRHARDGSFPAVQFDRPIWDQYPLGSFLTPLVLMGEPRKCVAVKGTIPVARGNHHAYDGQPVPSRDYYIPVHHFKWTAQVPERLAARAAEHARGGHSEGAESVRMGDYLRSTGGRIQVEDPRLLFGECAPDYPHWETIKKVALSAPFPPRHAP